MATYSLMPSLSNLKAQQDATKAQIDAVNATRLAFELGMDGTLKGDTLEERARSLVGTANRRGRIMQLIELCRRERPEGGF